VQNNSITRTTYHNSSSTFVPAVKAPQPPAQIVPYSAHELLPSAALTGHARQDDNALTHARATLLVSLAYIIAALMITLGLLLLAWLFKALGERMGVYMVCGLLVWGVCVLCALLGNRHQSLHHSPTGVAHAEIGSRERLAKYAIDTHARLLLARWSVDHE